MYDCLVPTHQCCPLNVFIIVIYRVVYISLYWWPGSRLPTVAVKAPLSLRPYGGRGYEFRSVSSWSFNAFARHSVSSHDCLSYDGIQNI